MEVLAVACKHFSGTFTFPGSGAVKRFVITTSVNQVLTARKYDWIIKLLKYYIIREKQICFS